MLNGLDILNEIRAPLKELMDNFADAVAERVIAKMKAEEADKPKYYTRKELCELLHVTTPTVIELVKRGEICEKRIGGRILYDAAEIDKAVQEQKIFRYKRRRNASP